MTSPDHQSGSVLVVGSFVQDLIFRTRLFPQPGQTVEGQFLTGPGGKGSNQAVASASCGMKTHFIGAVGKDLYGEAAKAFHRERGIHSRWKEVPDQASGSASIVVNEQAENQIVVALGANLSLLPRDAIDNWPEDAAVLVTQQEIPHATNLALLKEAGKRSVFRIHNPAPLGHGDNLALAAECDLLVPNETELAGLCEKAGPTPSLETMAQWCRTLPTPMVLVTLGSKGALLVNNKDGGAWRHFPPLPDTVAVDTTGAGDAFNGALAAGWIAFGGELDAAIAVATTVAGLSVRKPGTASSLPTREAITQTLKEWTGMALP